MDSQLHDQLHCVADRCRSESRWRGLAIAWATLTATTCLLGFMVAWYPVSPWLVAGLGGTGLLIAIVVALYSSQLHHDPRAVAARIEQHFPELQQALLTAVEQSPPADGSFHYLQRVLNTQVLAHDSASRWIDVVPDRHLRRWRWLNRLLLGCWITSLVWLAWSARHSANSFDTTASPHLATAMTNYSVEPGDAQLERGRSLIVVAKFTQALPREVHLVIHGGHHEGQILMTRSLDDPLFSARIPSVTDDLDYRVEFDSTRTENYHVTIFEHPELQRADAELRLPAYTQIPPKTVTDTRRVSAVEGSQVIWTCHLNKPVVEATLTNEAGVSVALTAMDGLPHAYQTSMSVSETSRWKLSLRDAEGRVNQHHEELFVRALPNSPPDLRMQNARDVSVSPLEELPVAAQVADDYGLQRYGITYRLSKQPARDVELGQKASQHEQRIAQYLLDFESFQAAPDQLLAYHFWAEDVGPDGQVRRTVSDMFFAEVRPFDEIFRQGDESAGESAPGGAGSGMGSQATELAELQKQIIAATWKVIRRELDAQVTDKFEDDVRLLEESQAQAHAQLQEMAEPAGGASGIGAGEDQMKLEAVDLAMQQALEHLTAARDQRATDPLHDALDAEQESYQGLLAMRPRESRVTQSSSASGSAGSGGTSERMQQQLQELELDNDRQRYERQTEATASDDATPREMRQVVNRLRELAQRQEDLNRQLQQLQTALEAAENAEEREAIEQQLQRLREQQREMLRDADELTERMDQPQNQSAMSETRKQLSETRQSMQQASEALQEGEVTQALASGARVERELETMRDQLRQESASQFNEQMRDMREEVRQVEQTREQLTDLLQQLDSPNGDLRADDSRQEIERLLKEQQERLSGLLSQMEQTIHEAEGPEPLLAQKLYDALRSARQSRTQENLELARQLLERKIDFEVEQVHETTEQPIRKLRQGIEQAAESVLGNEAESLRRAEAEVDSLVRELEQELQREDPAEAASRTAAPGTEEAPRSAATQPPLESNAAEARSARDAPSAADAPSANALSADALSADALSADALSATDPPSATPPTSAEASSTSPPVISPSNGSSDGATGGPRNESRRDAAGPPESASASAASANSTSTGSSHSSERRGPSGGIATLFDDAGAAPLTGDQFSEWSDRLRDVEEMVDDPELRGEAARIRQRARETRREFIRHSAEPQWSLVREMIAEPLYELRQKIREELIRKTAEHNLAVPIDRDPVPEPYAESVRRYYERLGSGE